MTFPDPVVKELTEDRIREIVRDESSNLIADIESRLKLTVRQTINEALTSVPSVDIVRQMIDGRIQDTRTELQASINSMDMHLRQAEGSVSEARKRMDNAVDKLDGFVTRTDELLTNLTAKTEVNTGNIASLQRETDAIRIQADTDRNELTQTIDKLDGLKADVHGDASKPEMPSLFRVVALTNDNIKSLDLRLARYDAMVNFALRIWNTKVGKAVIVSLLFAFGTDMVFQATKIWQVLLGGR